MALQIQSLILIVIFAFVTVYATAPIIIEADIPDVETIAVKNPEDYRLDKNEYIPEKYEIEISLDNNFISTKTFKGKVKIHVKPKTSDVTPTNLLLLNVANLKINNVSIKKEEGSADVPIKKPLKDANLLFQTQELEFTPRPEKKENLVIEADYDGTLHTDMYGFYINEYVDENKNKKIALATQFQPTYARRLMPCFDEPEYKATFKLTLKYPENYRALFNTMSSGRTVRDGLATEVFQETPSMSTYLLAIVVSEFNHVGATEDNISHAVWTRYKGTIGAMRSLYSLELSPKLLKIMQGFTNKNFKDISIGKVDHIALPDFSAGAMENWGLVTYRESLFLHDEKESTARNKQRVCSIIAHELAHFWFGNLKTTKWWDNTWLNEGFARYFEYMAAHEIEPTWELDKQFVVEQHLSVMNADSIPSATALESKVDAPSEISGKFNSISYNKGASIIRMLSHWTIEQKFKEILQAYFSDGNTSAVPENLWDAVGDKIDNLPAPIKNVIEPYVKTPGLPLILVDVNNNKVKITQVGRFELVKSDPPKEVYYFVPITYTTGPDLSFKDTTPKHWLKDEKGSFITVDVPQNAVVIVNLRATAYARVNYDQTLWDRIIAALDRDDFGKIEDLNRAQIVDDALNLARAGTIDYKLALKIVSYLEKETSYYPWYSAFNAFKYLLSRLPHKSEEATQLKSFIRYLMRTVNTVAIDEKKHVDVLKKSLVTSWSCNLDDPNCIQEMSQLFKEAIVEGKADIKPNFRSTAYCIGLRENDTKDNWNLLFKRFQETNLPSEAQLIIPALGCTRNEELLKGYLDKTVAEKDSQIRRQDTTTVFTSVAGSSSKGLEVATKFFKENVEKIEKHYDSVTSILSFLIDKFTTDKEITEFTEFINKINPAPSFKEAAIKMLDTATNNVKWTKEKMPLIKEFVVKYLRDREPAGTPLPNDETTTKKNGSVTFSVASIFLVISNIFIVMQLRQLLY